MLFRACISDWSQYLQPLYLIATFPSHNHFSIHLGQIFTLKMEVAFSPEGPFVYTVVVLCEGKAPRYVMLMGVDI